MQQSLHSKRFPRPLLPCHNNDHYHHCVKRGLSYRYINPGTPLLLWSNFTLISGPVLCMTVSWAVTGDHGTPPSFSELAESAVKEDKEAVSHLNHKMRKIRKPKSLSRNMAFKGTSIISQTTFWMFDDTDENLWLCLSVYPLNLWWLSCWFYFTVRDTTMGGKMLIQYTVFMYDKTQWYRTLPRNEIKLSDI